MYSQQFRTSRAGGARGLLCYYYMVTIMHTHIPTVTSMYGWMDGFTCVYNMYKYVEYDIIMRVYIYIYREREKRESERESDP